MKKYLSIVKKDMLLLVRDWPGLAVLFIMPAVLLVIITLTQESAIPSQRSGMRIAVVNADSGLFGENVVRDLTKTTYFRFIRYNNVEEVRNAVTDGECQLAVIVPDGATEKLYALLNGSSGEQSRKTPVNADELAEVNFIYDPSVQKIFKDAVAMPLNALIQLTAVKTLMTRYTEDVNLAIRQQKAEFDSDMAEKDFFSRIPDFPYKNEVMRRFREELAGMAKEGPDIELPFSPTFSSQVVEIVENAAREERLDFLPGPLQNNIPAFTLFAMFFIVIPLAGSIINEKNHGTFNRMRSLPVSYFGIISGKITVFIVVCIIQFIFLILIGKYVMPLLGEESSIVLRVNFPALLVTLLATSLSAIGFGIMVGAFASTHGQAATFGSVLVVILALLGGIFVPVYMLPENIKSISVISPLRWGTDALLGVFGKSGGIDMIWKELCLLTGFFVASVLLSVKVFRKP